MTLPSASLDEAIALHRQGRFAQAEAIYSRLLEAQPRHADALQLLGVLAHQTGRIQRAIELITQALEVTGPQPQLQFNLAAALADANRIAEAEAAYRQVIALAPAFSDAYLNCGALLDRAGREEEAVAWYQEGLRCAGPSPALHCNLGSAWQRLGRRTEAREAYEAALSLDPRCAQAHFNLATLDRDARRSAEAIAGFRRAVQLDGQYFAAWHSLGQALHEDGQPEASLEAYGQALALRGDAYETLVNVGGVYRDLARFADGERVYAQALAIRPEGYEAINNLGLLLADQGRFDEALACFDRALQLAPRDVEAGLNRAFLLLQTGRYAAGWRQYEVRHATEPPAREAALRQPRWQGQPLAGKTIWVFAEQGLGDEIMFDSCLGDLVAEAAHCHVTCDRRLEPLLARSFPAATVRGVERGRENWAELSAVPCDYQIPAGSVPRYVRPDEASFARQQRYLLPDPRRLARWQARYRDLGPGLKVGISWRGGVRKREDRVRNVPLSHWAELARLEGIEFCSVQYGATLDECAVFNSATGRTLHTWPDSDPLVEIDDFAAQLAALDLVISVANATVHLAGALGVPTWLLLPPCWGWRWLHGRIDSPWYPSVAIYRQMRHGDWDGLFAQIRTQLHQLSACRDQSENASDSTRFS